MSPLEGHGFLCTFSHSLYVTKRTHRGPDTQGNVAQLFKAKINKLLPKAIDLVVHVLRLRQGDGWNFGACVGHLVSFSSAKTAV